MLGHTEDVCKKKGVIRTEWRKIQKPQPPPQSSSIHLMETQPANPQVQHPTEAPVTHIPPRPKEVSTQEKHFEAFTPVSKGASPKKPPVASAGPSTVHSNSFNVLNDVRIQDVSPDVLQREDSSNLLMTHIASWNVRGLNWSNKQEDVKLFLQLNNIGLVNLIETKIKRHNVEKIATNIFRGWDRANNFAISNGRTWVAWKPAHTTLLSWRRLIN